MSAPKDPARLRAFATAALLFVAGASVGIASDRMLLRPASLQAAPLTVDAMVDHLGLSESEAARVRVLLDSLHTELARVLVENPDSLRVSVHEIRDRIEAALPESARSGFREWILEHHQSMTSGTPHRALHGAP
jgi:hypothetical protein